MEWAVWAVWEEWAASKPLSLLCSAPKMATKKPRSPLWRSGLFFGLEERFSLTMLGSMSSSQPLFYWEMYSSQRLMELRFKDLELRIKGSRLEPFIEQLYVELSAQGLRFRPHVWISDEWFSPDGVPGIAIPFYLFHRRLAQLERAELFEVKGWSGQECMKLLRHEAGHAIDNAFGLRRIRRRQKLFGLSSEAYPTFYSYRSDGNRFVRHLNPGYAQAHPDEDWAETFAVWLNPRSNWRKLYKGKVAYAKLELIDELMSSLRGRSPLTRGREKPGQLSLDARKMGDYYKAKRERLLSLHSRIKLKTPQNLYCSSSAKGSRSLALDFWVSEQPAISQKVSSLTGQHAFVVERLLDRELERVAKRGLYLKLPWEEAKEAVIGQLSAEVLCGKQPIAM